MLWFIPWYLQKSLEKMSWWNAIWTLFISTIDLIYIMAFEVWTGDAQILSSYLYVLVAMQRKQASYFIVGWKIPSWITL